MSDLPKSTRAPSSSQRSASRTVVTSDQDTTPSTCRPAMTSASGDAPPSIHRIRPSAQSVGAGALKDADYTNPNVRPITGHRQWGMSALAWVHEQLAEERNLETASEHSYPSTATTKSRKIAAEPSPSTSGSAIRTTSATPTPALSPQHASSTQSSSSPACFGKPAPSLASLQTAITDMTKDISSLKKKTNSTTAEMDRLSEGSRGSNSTLEEMSKEIAALKKQNESSTAESVRLRAALDSIRAASTRLDACSDSTFKEIASLKKEKESTKAELSRLWSAYNNSQSLKPRFEFDLEELKSTMETVPNRTELERFGSVYDSKSTKLQAELDALKSSMATALTQVEKRIKAVYDDRSTRIEATVVRLKGDITSAPTHVELECLREANAKLAAELAELKNTMDTYPTHAELDDLRDSHDIDQATNIISKLEAELEQLRVVIAACPTHVDFFALEAIQATTDTRLECELDALRASIAALPTAPEFDRLRAAQEASQATTNTRLETELDALRTSIATLPTVAELDRLRVAHEASQAMNTSLAAEVAALRRTISTLPSRGDLDHLRTAYDSSQSANAKLAAEVEELRNTHQSASQALKTSLTAEIGQLRNTVSTLPSHGEFDRLRTAHENTQSANAKSVEELKNTQQASQAILTAEIRELRNTVSTFPSQNELDRLRTAYDSSQVANTKLAVEVEALRTTVKLELELDSALKTSIATAGPTSAELGKLRAAYDSSQAANRELATGMEKLRDSVVPRLEQELRELKDMVRGEIALRDSAISESMMDRVAIEDWGSDVSVESFEDADIGLEVDMDVRFSKSGAGDILAGGFERRKSHANGIVVL